MAAEFEVEGEPGQVVVRSSRRLPFEPKGWLLEQREATRVALRALPPSPWLHCTYACDGPMGADVENVLVYNIGYGSLRPLTREGIVIEQARGGALTGPLRHVCTYRPADGEPPLVHWRTTEELVAVDVPLLPTSEQSKPDGTWFALRPAIARSADGVHAGPFAARVVLTIPDGTNRCAAALVKSVLDGFIAACHVHDGTDGVAVERLAIRLGQPVGVVSRLLNEGGAPLGRRRLVWSRAAGLQWNPADDRCVAISLALGRSKAREWRLEGRLFGVEPV